MTMLFLTYGVMLTSLALASARDTGKLLRTVPTISNSLVNLGKMQISFYLNGKQQDMPSSPDYAPHTEFYPAPPALEDSCPCTNFKPSAASLLSDPTEIINRILKSNDLFKDPSSSACCDSLEHMRDSSVVFEMSPNNVPTYSFTRSPIPMPFFYNKGGAKPKTIEIFMIPHKNKGKTNDITKIMKPKKQTLFKPDIHAVGDKELSVKPPSTSVKKDLALLEKKNNQETIGVPKEDLNTDAPPVTSINNVL